ncbi:peptidoglycan-binding domain-containing protein [Paraliomyxa miuraensis]|uniref:peptidoglycan-binding domain-containing protein n=1 Tax=Paraliomyxa miuraensis TaxID=376150 RepID=UPI00224F1E49|nr:peptidoglycan-binding domain-containing protein [Paraliomyxa miuraensis]MCX4247638.1 peptidoglycan-binding protein [Paraliomyxa miuraensis]
MSAHRVKQGECMATIAALHGWLPQSLWEQPENDALREQRKDPNCLLPGDVVQVPARRSRDEPVQTDAVGTFQLAVVPLRLRLRLLDGDEPRAGEAYRLEYDDGEVIEAGTDGDGWIDQPLPIGVRKAKLALRDGAEEYELHVGGLDPVDTHSGAQARLRNLGLYFGRVDGQLGPKTEAALRRFQRAKGLTATGAVDDATIEALRGDYGG